MTLVFKSCGIGDDFINQIYGCRVNIRTIKGKHSFLFVVALLFFSPQLFSQWYTKVILQTLHKQLSHEWSLLKHDTWRTGRVLIVLIMTELNETPRTALE